MILRKRIARNMFLLSGGTAISQALGFFVAPVLTRLFSPAEFGVYSIFLAVFNFLSSISCLRYEQLIPIVDSDDYAHSLFKVSLVVNALFASIVIFFLSSFREVLSDALNAPSIKNILWMAGVGSFGSGLYLAFRYLALRYDCYKAIGITTVNQRISESCLQIVFGVMNMGARGLIIGTVVGRAVGVLTLYKKLSIRTKLFTKSLLEISKEHRRFSMLSSLSTTLSIAELTFAPILISILFSSTIVGFIGFTQRLLTAPMKLIGHSTQQTLLPVIARESSPEKVITFMNRTIKTLAMLGFAPFVIVTIMGRFIFGTIFGSSWATAGTYASILSPLLFVRFFAFPVYSTIFLSYNRQDYDLYFSFGQLSILISSLAFGKLCFDSAISYLIVYSVCSIFLEIFRLRIALAVVKMTVSNK